MTDNGSAVNATVSNDVARVTTRLDDSSDGIDMDVPARVVSRQTVYTGAIFAVEDMRIALRRSGGGEIEVRRQVLRHAPCVVMLVHDEPRDLYLVEREYRAGSDRFAYGIPAGLMDDGESVMGAALRELAEETGVVPDDDPDAMRVDRVGGFYSSEGMTDEYANVMVLHLSRYTHRSVRFDPDEHVESAWVTWRELSALPIAASNSVIAIQHEALRRVRAGLDA